MKDKLEKACEFMKQFVIDGMNLLERFWNGLGEGKGCEKRKEVACIVHVTSKL